MSKGLGQYIGKQWQKKLEAVFKSLTKTHGFEWHRFIDSHDAGNLVQSQPSDYLILLPSGLTFLEAKASSTAKKLRPSMLRPMQRKTVKHWCELLGCPYHFLFHDVTNDKVDLVNGLDVLADGFSKRYPVMWTGTSKQLKKGLIKAWNLKPIQDYL